jgi:large subunit ribosomal protein L18
MKLAKKQKLAQNRRWRIRKKIRGTAERPRLTVCFTNQHVYAQCIDDTAAKTLVAASSGARSPNWPGRKASKPLSLTAPDVSTTAA